MNQVVIALGYPHSERDERVHRQYPKATILTSSFIPSDYVFHEHFPKDTEHVEMRRRFITALQREDELIVVNPWYTTDVEIRWYEYTAHTYWYTTSFALLKVPTDRLMLLVGNGIMNERFLALSQTVHFANGATVTLAA